MWLCVRAFEVPVPVRVKKNEAHGHPDALVPSDIGQAASAMFARLLGV